MQDQDEPPIRRPDFWEESREVFPAASAGLVDSANDPSESAHLSPTFVDDSESQTFYELCREGRGVWMSHRRNAGRDVETMRRKHGDESVIQEFLNALSDAAHDSDYDDLRANIEYARVAQKLVLKLAPRACGQQPNRRFAAFKSNDPRVRLASWFDRMASTVNKNARGDPSRMIRHDQISAAHRAIEAMDESDFSSEERMKKFLKVFFPAYTQIRLVPAPWIPVWCAKQTVPNWYETAPLGWSPPDDDTDTDDTDSGADEGQALVSRGGGPKNTSTACVAACVGISLILSFLS